MYNIEIKKLKLALDVLLDECLDAKGVKHTERILRSNAGLTDKELEELGFYVED